MLKHWIKLFSRYLVIKLYLYNTINNIMRILNHVETKVSLCFIPLFRATKHAACILKHTANMAPIYILIHLLVNAST